MTNKYQEALDRLRVDCNGRYDENGNSIPALSQKDGNDSLDTLQELIDIHTIIVKSPIQFEKGVWIYSDGGYPPDTVKLLLDGRDATIGQLAKALDKACEYLEDGYSNDCPSMEHPFKFDYPCRENEKIETKEQWKEWLLNGK